MVVTCEGNKQKSHFVTNSSNPKWQVEYVFYRFKLNKPIEIEIWDANYVKDAFLGRVSIPAPVDNVETDVDLPLNSRKPDQPPPSGHIYLKVATYDDVKYL